MDIQDIYENINREVAELPIEELVELHNKLLDTQVEYVGDGFFEEVKTD